MEFPRQEYWNDCHFLLQGIFPTQGSKPWLLNWQADSLSLNHPGSPIVLSSGNLELISVFRDLQSILQITWKYILTVLEEGGYMSVYLEIVFNLKKKKGINFRKPNKSIHYHSIAFPALHFYFAHWTTFLNAVGDGQYQNQINYILCSQRWRSFIQ